MRKHDPFDETAELEETVFEECVGNMVKLIERMNDLLSACLSR